MYLAYPAKVPTAAADVPDAGVSIEMGGFVRLDGSTFRRQIVHYNKDGKVYWLAVHHRYRSCDNHGNDCRCCQRVIMISAMVRTCGGSCGSRAGKVGFLPEVVRNAAPDPTLCLAGATGSSRILETRQRSPVPPCRSTASRTRSGNGMQRNVRVRHCTRAAKQCELWLAVSRDKPTALVSQAC